MGQEVCRAVVSAPDMELVGAVNLHDMPRAVIAPDVVVDVHSDLERAVRETGADVGVDFTHPSVVKENIRKAVASEIGYVVGTTGLTAADLVEVRSLLAQGEGRSRVFVAPNFSIGAVLMMHFAGLASRHLPAIEIIELHHDGKADAPSGTALATAKKAAEAGARSVEVGVESHPGARGGKEQGIRIHSVRLPGYIAHQEVLLGGPGQILSIRHDTTDRTAFMPGVLLAVRKVRSLPDPLTVGLEKLLEL